MALSREAKATFVRAWSRLFSTQTIGVSAFMSVNFFGAREQKKLRAPFRARTFFNKTPGGNLRPDSPQKNSLSRERKATISIGTSAAAKIQAFFYSDTLFLER